MLLGRERGTDVPCLELSLQSDSLAARQARHRQDKRARPDDWRGIETRERVVKAAMYDVLKDVEEVERLFLIVKARPEY